MSDELLAKVVAERNRLQEQVAKQKADHAAKVEKLKANIAKLEEALVEANKREFDARVDALSWKADLSREKAQRNLLRVHAANLEKQVEDLKRLVADVK
jgi:chromosome segregation ATPase